MNFGESEVGVDQTWSYPEAKSVEPPPAMQQIAELREQLERLRMVNKDLDVRIANLERRLG